jgi:cardiolipin synthase
MVRRSRKRKRLSDAPPFPWAEYCRHFKTLHPGNRVELLVDGAEAYPAMLKAISEAEHTILMASYIFNDDKAGGSFSEALAERAGQGVSAYLIADGVGTLHVPREFFADMEKAGVKILIYRSPAPWRRSFGLLRRDHRKLLVVDGRIGFAGGLNIGDEWLPKDMGGQGWHDVHLRVEGPAVRDLSKQAVSTWQIHSGQNLDPQLFLRRVEPSGEDFVNIVGSRERKKRKAIRQSYLQAIRTAKAYIYIANAYFLPDRGFRRALKNACKRGVDVRVMVPKRGDILPFQLASEAFWGRALRYGIGIFLWQDAVLHAKTAVIDDQWATVGSFNIDHRSWAMNLEVNVNIVGPKFAQQLKSVFLKDQKRCFELTRHEWRKRPWYLRLVQNFFYLFKKFM